MSLITTVFSSLRVNAHILPAKKKKQTLCVSIKTRILVVEKTEEACRLCETPTISSMKK